MFTGAKKKNGEEELPHHHRFIALVPLLPKYYNQLHNYGSFITYLGEFLHWMVRSTRLWGRVIAHETSLQVGGSSLPGCAPFETPSL